MTARTYEKVIEHIMKLPFKDGFIVLHFRFATPSPSHVNRQQFGNTPKFTNLPLLALATSRIPLSQGYLKTSSGPTVQIMSQQNHHKISTCQAGTCWDTLPETNSSPLKLEHPKRKFIFQSSNHPFSGVNSLLVSGSFFLNPLARPE